MRGISRRSFIGLAASCVASSASAAMVGNPGSLGLLTLLDTLACVRQGYGERKVRILVSPGCDHSVSMFATVAERLGDVDCAWIPFAGGKPGMAPLACLLGMPSTEALEAFLGSRGDGRPSPDAYAAAERQDRTVETAVAMALWSATGRPLAAPTLAYASSGLVRVVRGSFGRDVLDAVLSTPA